MSKTLFNKIVIYAVVVFLLILAPNEINVPNQATIRAICTGLAVDASTTTPGNISVTSQIVIPQAGGQYNQNMSVVTAEGEDIMDAFSKMDYQIGKKVRLAHCCFVIIGYEASQQNLANLLDYLVRGNNTGNNIVLVHTRGLAKDIIKIATSVNSNEIDNIQAITEYNGQYLSSKESNLKSFYDDYLSPHSTSVMTCIKKAESDQGQSTSGSSDGGSGGSGGSSGGGSGGGDSQQANPDKIENEGEISVFKAGRLATVLSSEDRQKFNWLDSELRSSLVKLEHITTDKFDDATIGFTITEKEVKKEFKFVNNQPCVYFTINLKLRTEMIENADGTILPNENYNDDTIRYAFNQKANKDISDAMLIQRDFGFDMFNFYQSFEIADYARWCEYLESLEDKSEYIENVQVFAKINTDMFGLGSFNKSFQ